MTCLLCSYQVSMGRTVCVGATQFSCCSDKHRNWDTAEEMVRLAAGKGAQIVLLQELFSEYYFCQEQDSKWFRTAIPSPFSEASDEERALFVRMSKLAQELNVVLPISFFERAGNNFFNSLIVIDAGNLVLEWKIIF
jgi:N-carbamoylputrescine amidase